MCSFGGCDTFQGFAKIPWSNSDNQWTILVLFLKTAVSHCWLLWTCVSHQPPVRDSDIPVLPSARSHCTWTNPEGQGKDCIWDLLPVFGVKLGLSLFANSFCPVSFQVVDLDNSGLQMLALQSCRACLAERKVCFPAQFLCNRGLFPAEILVSGECSQCGPLGGTCWVAQPLWLASTIKKVRTGWGSSQRQANTLVDSLHYSLAHIVLPPKYNSGYTCITLR